MLSHPPRAAAGRRRRLQRGAQRRQRQRLGGRGPRRRRRPRAGPALGDGARENRGEARHSPPSLRPSADTPPCRSPLPVLPPLHPSIPLTARRRLPPVCPPPVSACPPGSPWSAAWRTACIRTSGKGWSGCGGSTARPPGGSSRTTWRGPHSSPTHKRPGGARRGRGKDWRGCREGRRDRVTTQPGLPLSPRPCVRPCPPGAREDLPGVRLPRGNPQRRRREAARAASPPLSSLPSALIFSRRRPIPHSPRKQTTPAHSPTATPPHGRALVVAPSSLIHSWQRELRGCGLGGRVHLFYGDSKGAPPTHPHPPPPTYPHPPTSTHPHPPHPPCPPVSASGARGGRPPRPGERRRAPHDLRDGFAQRPRPRGPQAQAGAPPTSRAAARR